MKLNFSLLGPIVALGYNFGAVQGFAAVPSFVVEHQQRRPSCCALALSRSNDKDSTTSTALTNQNEKQQGNASSTSATAPSTTGQTMTPRVQREYETYMWTPPLQQKNDHAYKINYRVEGQEGRPPVLLVHGFGANVNHFRYQFPALVAAGYRVYAIDLLGFGASDKPAHVDYSIELFVQLLIDFVKDMSSRRSSGRSSSNNSNEKWFLAGNSVGGLCCLGAASQTLLLDNMVQGIVLFNCSGGLSVFRYQDVPIALRPILWFVKNVILNPNLPFGSFFFANFKTRENVEQILRQQVYLDQTNVDEDLLDILLAPSEDPGAKDVFLRVFGGPPGPTPESILPTLKGCPILALWGGSDPWTPVDSGAHPGNGFAQYVENAEEYFTLEVLPGVGHCPHDESPDLVNQKMVAWMEKIRAAAAK